MLSSPVPRENCAALSLLLVCAISVAFLASQRLQPAEAATAAPNNATRHVTAKTVAFVPAGNTIVINSTADAQNASDGLCTLREAIAAANDNVASGATAGECAAGSSGSDTVDLTGLTGTITLTSGLPFITSDMTINGPGANQLTVQRSMAVGTPNFRIFTIGSGAVVTISGLTISNGNAGGTSTDGYGGGIFNQGSLTLNDSNVYGNTSLSIGGGIYHAGPSLTINDCNIGGTAAGQPNSSGESGA